MASADVVVIGVGAMGSATCYELARRGADVVGVERFEPGHDRGSSHGDTRIIRLAYFEHPDYVPLLRRAYACWRELGERVGEELIHRTGLLFCGGADSSVLRAIRRSASEHDLPFEDPTPAEARDRFPAFRIPDDRSLVFEADAGYLEVEHCVRALAAAAAEEGARIRTGERVLEWSAGGGGVEVRTDRGRIRARMLVITAGAWAGGLLAGRKGPPPPLRVLRKVIFWHRCGTEHRVESGFPCFFFDHPLGWFYGFPAVDGSGLKVGNHSGGEEIADPDALRRDVAPGEGTDVVRFLADTLPGVATAAERSSVCMYTMTPDENFLIDRHPHFDDVIVAAGFSGHGFKLAPVVGEVVADLALSGSTRHPVGFLKWRG